MKNCIVSILIPCYNAQKWIEQAIESSLNQSYSNKEIIVVDDGSTDDSLNIIKSFSDRITLEASPNRGGNATRNRLLELSTGEWLQYLDADDYLLPKKVEKQVKFLENNPDVDLVYSPSIIEHHNREETRQEILSIPQPHDPWVLLARWYLPQTGSPLWRKQAIIDVGGWKINQPCCQEHELYLRLLKAQKRFAYFDDASSVYRQWSESTVCKKNKAETYRRRLKIVDRLEQHLERNQQLTKLRQNAINHARFECARLIWLEDTHWANNIIKKITNKEKLFLPQGNYAPASYRLFYKYLGFEIAEKIASFKRYFLIFIANKRNKRSTFKQS